MSILFFKIYLAFFEADIHISRNWCYIYFQGSSSVVNLFLVFLFLSQMLTFMRNFKNSSSPYLNWTLRLITCFLPVFGYFLVVFVSSGWCVGISRVKIIFHWLESPSLLLHQHFFLAQPRFTYTASIWLSLLNSDHMMLQLQLTGWQRFWTKPLFLLQEPNWEKYSLKVFLNFSLKYWWQVVKENQEWGNSLFYKGCQ